MDDQNQSITAYHGSPHDFDQFDMAKIGKGVGEQAYGHGLYFTEHEPTAIDFRDRATASKNINDFNLYRISGSNEEFEPKKQGHMYEVNINAHPDHMLDWNKPLSEQSPYIVKSIFDARKDNPTLFNVFKSHFEKNSTGMDFYQALATQHPNGYQGASEFLQRSGVHGVKYRDENNRDKGKGTTNYVVFDPKNVDVKRKYEQGGEVIPHDNPQREENLAAWHKGSHPSTQNEDGTPRVFYHGTQADFSTFNRGHKGIFVSPDPEFAQAFSERKGSYTNANIMPVYVHAKNPFDYENPNHVEKLKKIVRFKGGMTQDLLDEFHDALPEGQWDWVEHPDVQDAIKKLGHDGYYINETEDGEPYKNLAVYNPNQIKSATGNNGDFNPSSPKITEARGGSVIPHDDPQRKENLDNWHEDSHPLTKNEDGSPKVYYHGTSKDKDFKKFNVGRHGAWVTDDPNEASMYAEANDSQGYKFDGRNVVTTNTASRVMPVHVKITKPYTGAMPSHFATTDNYKRAQSNFFDHLRSQGFDGWIPQEQGGLVAVALSNPTQIKSSLGNNGNFDPSKPNINEARGGRIGYDEGGDVRTGDNPGGAADANRSAVTSRDADRNYNAGSGTQTAGPSSDNRPDNRPDNSNDRFNIGGGGAPMPPQRGDDSFFGNMGGNIGSVLGGLAFGPIGSIGGRYLGNQFNQPDNSRFEAKNDEFGNPIGNNGGWLDFLGSGNPPAPMTSDNRRDPIIKPIKPKRKVLMPDGTYQEVEEGMKSGGVAKSYNRVHNSKIVEHALSKVGVSLHTRRPPS